MAVDHKTYRAILADLGISHAEFARLIATPARTERRWAAGETELPGAVSTLVELLHARPELVSVLRARLEADKR